MSSLAPSRTRCNMSGSRAFSTPSTPRSMRWPSGPDGHLILLGVDGVEKALDPLILHRVLDGAKEDILLESLPEFQCLGVLDHLVTERLVDLLMDKYALQGKADLGNR